MDRGAVAAGGSCSLDVRLPATDQQAFNARAAAVRAIWYLDTPESVREAARLLGALDEQTARPLQKALLGSRHQDAVIAAMKQPLRLPDQAVTPLIPPHACWELEVEKQVPLAAESKLSEAAVRRRSEAVGATVQGNYRVNSTAWQNGSGAMQRRSRSRLCLTAYVPRRCPANLRAEMAGLFPDLPFQQQNELLTSQWKRIAGPAMIPVLLQIYEKAPATPGLQQSLAPKWRCGDCTSSTPPGRGTLIIDEMKLEQPLDHPRLRDEALAILPDATLPDLDAVLLDHFQRNGRSQQLIARYATADILEGVKAWSAKEASTMRARNVSSPALIAYYLPRGSRVG